MNIILTCAFFFVFFSPDSYLDIFIDLSELFFFPVVATAYLNTNGDFATVVS